MKYKCYTFGYYGKPLDALIKRLNADNALLVDIRRFPHSTTKNWNPNSLKALLSENYLHLEELGNVSQKGGILRIANMDKGSKTVLNLLQHRPVVLMCACQCLDTCYRNTVAAELEGMEENFIIEELEIG